MSNAKVQASSRPEGFIYGIFVVDSCNKFVDEDTNKVVKFQTYNDALIGLKQLGYTFWNPENCVGVDKPEKAAYVCYVEEKDK